MPAEHHRQRGEPHHPRRPEAATRRAHGAPNEPHPQPRRTDRKHSEGEDAAGNARRTHGCRFRFTEPSRLVRSGDELDQHSSQMRAHDRAEGVSTPPFSSLRPRCKAPLSAAIRVAARGSGLPRVRCREGSVQRNLHLCVLPALPAASPSRRPCRPLLSGLVPPWSGPRRVPPSGSARCLLIGLPPWPPGPLAPWPPGPLRMDENGVSNPGGFLRTR